jgi:hypothetical protein
LNNDSSPRPDAIIYSHGLIPIFDLQPVTTQGYKVTEHYQRNHRGTIRLPNEKEYEDVCALFDYAGLHIQPL